MTDPGLPFKALFPNFSSWLLIIIGTVVLGSYIMVNQLIAPWFERKIMARMQGRRGPVYVGKLGILQIPADLLKLAMKEDTRPEGADKFGFFISIAVVSISCIASFAPLPFGSNNLLMGNYSIGLLYVFGVFSLFPPFMVIAGWSSNSKYSLIGGFRSAGQLIAYEIPMLVSALAVISVTGSFSLLEITQYQMIHGWFIFRYLGLGFISAFIFFISAIAETERIPFDIPEAEAELVMGPRTEFASWRYALLLMVEYIHLWVNGFLFAYLFLGGYDPIWWPNNALDAFRFNPWIQFITMTVKAYFVVYVATHMRVALARFRIDQFLKLGWGKLLPLSLIVFILILGFSEVHLFGLL